MQRKRLFILAVVVVVALSLILWLQVHRDSKNPSVQTAPTRGVVITNVSQLSRDLDQATIASIETTAYQRIAANFPGTMADKYAAVVRAGTYEKQYHRYEGTDPAEQVPSVSFLLDIPAAKESFTVTFSGGRGYPYSILYVLCPSADQLIYGDFGCVDENQ